MADIADLADDINEHRLQQGLKANKDKLKPNDITDCEKCGDDIPEARKEALPSCKLCISCASLGESKHWG